VERRPASVIPVAVVGKRICSALVPLSFLVDSDSVESNTGRIVALRNWFFSRNGNPETGTREYNERLNGQLSTGQIKGYVFLRSA
jgi:hypothetical protein